MTTLYVAWQHQHSRQWFPVGRLIRHDSDAVRFEFAYVQGANDAKESAGFRAMPGFPSLRRLYRASELFPTFRNRLMNVRRLDRPAYLRQLGFNEAECDELAELSVSSGRSHADSFEVFPAIEPDADGRFSTQLMLHGLQHTNPNGIDAVRGLRSGHGLRVAVELNNPITTHAILVYTQDYHVLGWLPRYLFDSMHRDGAWMVFDVKAAVAQVNHDAPLSHRLLVDFSGRFPPGVHPMQDLEQYQPIAVPEKTVFGQP